MFILDHTCPACGGICVPLGALGKFFHMRCQRCGIDCNTKLEEEPVSEEVQDRETLRTTPEEAVRDDQDRIDS